MTKTKSDFIESYHELTKEIDTISLRLSKMHAEQILCKPGCSSCCESISVFEVEFDAIQTYLKNNQTTLPSKSFIQKFTKSCRYLVKNKCAIYEVRPIICRTQGLPILYRSFDNDNYELSVCKLNFKKVNPVFFNGDNALMLSPFNTQLLMLNQAYLKAIKPEEKNINKRRYLYELEEFGK